MTKPAEALAARASDLEEEARRHKRASAFHRRRAKEARQELAALRSRLAALGIETVTQPKEAQ